MAGEKSDVKRTILYKNNFVELYQVINPERAYLKEGQFENATVVAIWEDSLVVNRHFRVPIEGYIYDLPGGGVEPGETVEDAARRELLEESGIICGELHYLGKIYPQASLVNRVVHIFFTSDIIGRSPQELQPDEQIVNEYIPLSSLRGKIANGEWTDSELVHALCLAHLKGWIQL